MMTQEIPALTGIRGIAASVVVLAHLAIVPMAFAGLAVAVFFMLSGFVLAHVYRDGAPTSAFFRARAARTLPVHLATTALVAVSVGATWQQTAAAVLGFAIINPPVWSLIVEWYAYALFPILNHFRKEVMPADRQPTTSIDTPPSSQTLGAGAHLPILAISLIVFGYVLQMGHVGTEGLFGKVGGWGRVPEGLSEFTAGVALYRLGYRPRATWLTDNSFARWLGGVSYPLYLGHLLPAYWICRIAGLSPATLPLSMPWPMTIGCLVLPFALAVILHHTVEVPGRRILRSMKGARTWAYLVNPDPNIDRQV